jgi:hypothetical protein
MSGCSQSGPALVPVRGRVTVAGEPFVHGTVRFMPKSTGEHSPQGGFAVTDDEGNYELQFFDNRTGIEPGDYYVSFSLFKMPDGEELPDQTGEEFQKSATELGAVQFVPPEYARPDCQEFETSGPASGGEFEFDIPKLMAAK